MTDPQNWASPGGEAPAATTPQPIATTPGWTPPPRPGLIPLRPLTLGTLLTASFQVLRRNPRPTFGFALLINGIISVVTLGVVGAVALASFGRIPTANESEIETITAGSVASIIVTGIVAIAFSLVGSAILQGVISLEVARGTVGERLTLRGLWRRGKGRFGALVGWSALIAGVVGLAAIVITGGIVAVIALGGTAGIVVGVLLALGAGGAALVLGWWVGTRVSLVPSALIIERLSLRDAIVRSWTITQGYFWKTLGIQLLVATILSVVAQIITTPVGFIGGLLLGLTNPNSDQTAAGVGIVVLYLVTLLITVLFGAISLVIQSATATLIYLDLRMRKEGLDLELAKFVEARQAGLEVDDPYTARSTTA